MSRYTKPWLDLDQQADRLRKRGVEIGSAAQANILLRQVGYYRLTGYLYPFRNSEIYFDDTGRRRVRDDYRPGTTLSYAAQLIEYDRLLRLLVLDAVERIEVSLRMQIGFTVGRRSPFAHRDPRSFIQPFTAQSTDPDTGRPTSGLNGWLRKVQERQDNSDEAFVAHFRERYEGMLPIWALTEILELGHLSRLFSALQNDLATEIAGSFGVPTKPQAGGRTESAEERTDPGARSSARRRGSEG